MLTTKTPLPLLHFADGRQRISTGLNTRNTCRGLHIYTLSTEVWFLKKMSTRFEIWSASGCQFMLSWSFWSKSLVWCILLNSLSTTKVAVPTTSLLRGFLCLSYAKRGEGYIIFKSSWKWGHIFSDGKWWCNFYLCDFFLLTTTILIIDSNTFLTNLISLQDLLLQRFWNLCWILYNRITNFNCGKISNPGKFSFLHFTFFAYWTTRHITEHQGPWGWFYHGISKLTKRWQGTREKERGAGHTCILYKTIFVFYGGGGETCFVENLFKT